MATPTSRDYTLISYVLRNRMCVTSLFKELQSFEIVSNFDYNFNHGLDYVFQY